MPNLRYNIPETVKQLGSMYVATLVMGLGVALPAWFGWTCILIGVFLPVKTLRMNSLQVQEVKKILMKRSKKRKMKHMKMTVHRMINMQMISKLSRDCPITIYCQRQIRGALFTEHFVSKQIYRKG